MRIDNKNWTEIANKDVLRFGDLSHHQRKDKGITTLKDFTEVYLKCEDCDKAEKFAKVKHAWDLKQWKAFMRKGPVLKDETSGYFFCTRVEFYCPSCVERGK